MVEFGSGSSTSSADASSGKADAKASGDLTVTFVYQNDSGRNCILSRTESGINTSEYNASFDPTNISGSCSSPADFDGVKAEFTPGSGSSVSGLTLRILDEDGGELASDDGSDGQLSASATVSDDVTFPDDDGTDGGGDGASSPLIAYEGFKEGDNASTDIYTITPDGESSTQVTTDPYADSDPSWKPDGTRIAMRSSRGSGDGIDTRFRLFTISPSGENVKEIYTPSEGEVGPPSWGKDPNGGSQIVFSYNESNQNNIYSIKPDDASPTQLVEDATRPALSPDGTRIAFVKDGTIHTMNQNGDNIQDTGVSGTNPVWSPDGSKLAFTRINETTLNGEVYIISSDGSGSETQVTSNSYDDNVTDWKGSKLLLESDPDEDASNRIYTIQTDGSGFTEVTGGTLESEDAGEWITSE
jgi:Tol biopolymer transport system component